MPYTIVVLLSFIDVEIDLDYGAVMGLLVGEMRLEKINYANTL